MKEFQKGFQGFPGCFRSSRGISGTFKRFHRLSGKHQGGFLEFTGGLQFVSAGFRGVLRSFTGFHGGFKVFHEGFPWMLQGSHGGIQGVSK